MQDPRRFDASIVIPVFNRAELTQQCLVKLGQLPTRATYEVIVVDNASTDQTAELLASLGGDVQIIRNRENLGFAAASNQGACAAQGRYVVFLNNDTIPLPGWLDALVAELDTHPDVAVVGSKLLYPDNTIQHAGVAFLREGLIPFHVHSRQPADATVVNHRRELNCVTGACLIVRPEVFAAVGGFDEGFRNGFEDVDFCLQVRARGHRIVYQPNSVLYHLESQTPGRKTHDEANFRRLMARWGAHWPCFNDEDMHFVADGLCVRTQLEDGQEVRRLAPLDDLEERRRWQAVAAVQQAAQVHDLDRLQRLLAETPTWPADQSVQRWLGSIREYVAAWTLPSPHLVSA